MSLSVGIWVSLSGAALPCVRAGLSSPGAGVHSKKTRGRSAKARPVAPKCPAHGSRAKPLHLVFSLPRPQTTARHRQSGLQNIVAARCAIRIGCRLRHVEFQTMRGTDLVLDAIGDPGIVLQELLGVFAALTDAFVTIAEPAAGFLNHTGLHAKIQKLPVFRDALAVHDIEFHLLERWRH